MRVAFGCDHAGFELKPVVLNYLRKLKIEVIDMGTHDRESVDYPDIAALVSAAVATQEADLGILICGTGLGMAISANKVPGIRAVTVSEPYSAAMARAHNDANVITMGSRVIGSELAIMNLKAFLDTRFEGGRHCRRVDKMMRLSEVSFPEAQSSD
ncbi:MAG TPA: ribose 5-phosphate isomerase B [bacterium]|nr:ribose 5-phosphate isomerase B [bacterium]